MTAPQRQDLRWVWLASEVLLVATSIAAILMLERIFEDTSFTAPLIFTALVSHLVLIAMRWFGFGAATTGLVSLAATAAAIVAIHYGSTALAAIVPTGDTIAELRNDLLLARDLFRTTTTPVPAVTGFLVITSAAIWFVSFVADWAAFRLLAPGQALIPYVSMLIFVALLGTEQRRLATTATVMVCGVLFVLAHRAAARAAGGVWLDQGPGRGYASLMAAGGVVALIAALAGILGGPAVPGADEAPLVELGDEGRQQNRPLEVISPLVQIQPRLIDQSDRVLFTVETNQRAYWRIAALDVFDGTLWRSQGQFRNADDSLPVSYPSDAPVDSVTATFDLADLNVVWAPAAYLPTRFENLSGAGVNYESESATFIVDTNDQRFSDGLRYTVTSQIPRFTSDNLSRFSAGSAGDVDPRYLSLPADYSPLARQTALDITSEFTTPYGKALALQNYFRDNFTYNVEVAKGHDIRRLEDFLEVRQGYCEQFAGTYASMARAIGLPARVATGFTPGDADPDNPNRYLVRGKHAHAWPEVFISGAGWVAFEPTPGRGAPNASEYTGAPESQDSTSGNADASEAAQGQENELGVAPEAAPTPTPTPVPEDESATPLDLTDADGTNQGSSALRNLLLVLAALLIWALGVPALKRWVRQRRAQRFGTDTRRRITHAWATTADLLESHGHEPLESETLAEYSERIQRDVPTIAVPFADLTERAVEASYRSSLPSDAEADAAQRIAAQIRQTLNSTQPWLVRSVYEIDPRPLLDWRDSTGKLAERLASGATGAT